MEVVEIFVTPISDAPLATFATAQEAIEDEAIISGQLTATDVDGDNNSYKLLGAPIDGLNINADGTWSFDPSVDAYDSITAGDTAQITVGYGVTDSNNALSEGSFTINITGTNDKPVANAAALILPSIQEDTTLNISAAQL